ncbi:hypothetical protein BDY21DRAFT_277391 [Lineolata rhizophorae]|uniref:DUF4604 domain-containing protein n=1 Tax=Lineolata rhizophorae TaxID=578093 RepID=A0A6A6PDP4_9PEZI|nr:hypothetical protein BDY21DRAFT_277391 [Lineolata rhizophorae]
MSFKAKNLSYEAKEPAFLRRLRGEVAADPGTESRDRPSVARPKRLKNDDDDDEPTYVVEGSHDTLSKAEYDALVSGKSPDGEDGETKAGAPESSSKDAKEDPSRKKQHVAEVGQHQKKRKAAKVVGDAAEDTQDAPRSRPKKPKKKTKAVKLSFGDDEEDGQ